MRLVFEDHFDAPALDTDVWLPHYLPAWSSRAESAATYAIRDSCLHLSIPPSQGLWCAGDHLPPLRVSGLQSGNFSGPVGSTIGQQPYRDGVTVREEQEPFSGWRPDHGYLEMRARGVVTPRSMVAWWMVGLDDVPERSAEICVAEMFGDAVERGRSEGPPGSTTAETTTAGSTTAGTTTTETTTAVGMGVRAFRDPEAVGDFEVVRLPIDLAEFHTYAVDWTPERLDFLVDGAVVRTSPSPPAYPMQLMVAVFDFPDRSVGGDEGEVPELVVDYFRGYER